MQCFVKGCYCIGASLKGCFPLEEAHEHWSLFSGLQVV
jgi:hypothetical protein